MRILCICTHCRIYWDNYISAKKIECVLIPLKLITNLHVCVPLNLKQVRKPHKCISIISMFAIDLTAKVNMANILVDRYTRWPWILQTIISIIIDIFQYGTTPMRYPMYGFNLPCSDNSYFIPICEPPFVIIPLSSLQLQLSRTVTKKRDLMIFRICIINEGSRKYRNLSDISRDMPIFL